MNNSIFYFYQNKCDIKKTSIKINTVYYDDKEEVNMILDHNNTPLVAWNSTNVPVMKEVLESLINDTTWWKVPVILITAK